jgi:uncharacterized protein YjbI with pentapeptide repeats
MIRSSLHEMWVLSMKATLTALTVAATMFASSASAADPADLQTLKDTGNCYTPSAADPPNCDLSGANLTNANLAGAVLFVADLTGANLCVANLDYVSRESVNLKGFI